MATNQNEEFVQHFYVWCRITQETFKPEDHWSCIAHLSAEDMLKSAVIEEKMYIAGGQGQKTPGDKILMSTETSCHFRHLLQVSKKSL